jgi:hypothetical protein
MNYKLIISIAALILLLAFAAWLQFVNVRHLSPLIYNTSNNVSTPTFTQAEAASLSGIPNGNYTLYVLNGSTNETLQMFLSSLNEYSMNTTYPNFTRYVSALWQVGYIQRNVSMKNGFAILPFSEEVFQTTNPKYVSGFLIVSSGMNDYTEFNGTYDGINYTSAFLGPGYSLNQSTQLNIIGYENNTVFLVQLNASNVNAINRVLATVSNDISRYRSGA